MRIVTKLLATAAFALAMPALAAPEAVEEKNIVAGKQKLDPASGYIFVQANYRTFGTFLRVPDDSTRAEHKKDWDEAFAKAQKKYPGKIKDWEAAVQVAKQTKKQPPERPVEPTPENFSIDPIELRDTVSFGPMFIYSKDEAAGRFNYLTAVKPGTYIYYGPVLMQPGGITGGICFCMGTVRFEVRPGVITDLGNFLIAAPDAVKDWDVASADAWRRAEEKAAKKGEPVEAPGCLDVKGALADLLDRGNPGQGQKETEMVGEIAVGAHDRRVQRTDFLGLKRLPISRDDEFRLPAGCRWACPQVSHGLADGSRRCNRDMNMIALENTADVRLVHIACAEALQGDFLTAKSFEEGIGKFGSVKGLLSKRRNGFFNFNGIHAVRLSL